LEKVGEQSRAGKPRETEEKLKDLGDSVGDVVERGKGLGRQERDPEKRRKVEEAVSEIERLEPLEENAARNLAGKPNDPKAQRELDDVENKMDKALDNLGNELGARKGRGGGGGKDKNADKVEELLPRLEAAADKFRKNPNDPKARKELEDILDELEGPAGQFVDKGGKPGVRDEGQRVRDQAEELNDTLDDMETAARKGDGKGVTEAAKKAAGQEKILADAVRNLGEKEKDPERRKRLIDALEDLERLLPQNIRSAQNVLKNPKDPSAKKELGDTNDDMERALDTIENLADPRNEEGILAAAKKGKDAGTKLNDAIKKK